MHLGKGLGTCARSRAGASRGATGPWECSRGHACWGRARVGLGGTGRLPGGASGAWGTRAPSQRDWGLERRDVPGVFWLGGLFGQRFQLGLEALSRQD